MAEQVFRKDTDWGHNDDFVGEHELMVNITLHEYRDLLKDKFSCGQKLYQKNEKIEALTKERDEAIARLNWLKDTLGVDQADIDAAEVQS